MIHFKMIFISVFGLAIAATAAVDAQEKKPPRSQAELRGTVTAERAWWDVLHYDLSVEFFPETKTITGSNQIRFRTKAAGQRMQIDLQTPLKLTSAICGDRKLEFTREGNVYWVDFREPISKESTRTLILNYEGEPKTARRPPWEGGVTWTKDEQGNDFIVTTCQGLGASVWWPNKDHGGDEPDHGMDIRLTVPENLSAVSNGRLKKVTERDSKRQFHWAVTNPINNYCVNANIGNYVNFSDKFVGEFGELDIEYWVLEHQREDAQRQFKEAPRVLAAFEHWFGKYPFYEDSYKLVAVPYPGMEHQSSVTYGNGFKNGYGGRDFSGTGVGMKFDFIIVHESGHEWFGNNVSMQDAADMWIHESFTNYSENLFVEYHFSKQEAEDYVIGCRSVIKNDRPIIGQYGVNQTGSGDMYCKGGNMLHTMRHICADDQKWREVLRGINRDFWHQTVTTQQIESYINEKTGIDFTKFFDQYLRDIRIPVLVYKVKGQQLIYWYEDVVAGFDYPVEVIIDGKNVRLEPSTEKQVFQSATEMESVEIDRNFYYALKDANETEPGDQ